jgi:hypothetical protein
MATGRRRTLVVLALLLVGVVTLDTVSRGVVALVVVSSWTVGSGVIPEHSRMRGSTPLGVPRPGRRADVEERAPLQGATLARPAMG